MMQTQLVAPASSPPSFKRCSCGRRYTAAQWRALQLCGANGEWDDGFDVLELRNCADCGSTCAVFLRPSSNAGAR